MKVQAPFGFVTGCHTGNEFMVQATLASMIYYCPAVPICLIVDGVFDVSDLVREYDGCHSKEAIEITFQEIRPFLAKQFVYFIEDNFDTYDWLGTQYPQYYWTTRGEIAVATSR